MKMNRERLKNLFIKEKDNSVRFIGEELIVNINKKYENFGAFNIDDGINTLAIFNMKIDNEDYGYILPAVIKMFPSNIEEEKKGKEEEYKLTFKKNDIFIKSTVVVKRTDLIFAIFKMFVFFGIRYDFMTENNISRVFDNFGMTGFNMSYTDSSISSAIFSELYRNPKNIQELNRLVDNVEKGIAIGLKNISLTASKLTTKLAGSYLKENLTAAVIQEHTQESEIENLLRR